MTRKTAAAIIVMAIIGGVGATISLALPTGYASRIPPEDYAWQDSHYGYPAVPNGLSAITRTFGQPCSSDSRANTYVFVAADNDQPYPVHFHRRLGGADSSNLDNDIPGHIERKRLSPKLLSGIWGYNCRFKRNSSEYSAHAWGIAVDINSAHERPGAACRTIPAELGRIWTDHRWTWGSAWDDCMHFQYATGY